MKRFKTAVASGYYVSPMMNNAFDPNVLDNDTFTWLMTSPSVSSFTRTEALRMLDPTIPEAPKVSLELLRMAGVAIRHYCCADDDITALLKTGPEAVLELAMNCHTPPRFFAQLYDAGARAFHPNVIDVEYRKKHRLRDIEWFMHHHTYRGTPREYRRLMRTYGINFALICNTPSRWRFEDLIKLRHNFAWGKYHYRNSVGYSTMAIVSAGRLESAYGEDCEFVVDRHDRSFVCSNCNDTVANIDALCGLSYHILFNKFVSTADIVAYLPDDRRQRLINDAIRHFPDLRELHHVLTMSQIRLLGDDRLMIYYPHASLDDIEAIVGRCTPKMITNHVSVVRRAEKHAADVFALIVLMCDEIIALDGYVAMREGLLSVRASANDDDYAAMRDDLIGIHE